MARKQQKLDLDLNGGRDYTSSLPDELLSIILSKLNIVEGVRTTILSTRWRRSLWKLLPTSVLRIHASDFMSSYRDFLQGYIKECQGMEMNIKFEHIVDQILTRYTPDILDELNIHYHPSGFSTPTVINPRKPLAKVETWIEFAKQKSVKTLDLSFELFNLDTDDVAYKPLPLKSLTSTTFSSLVTLRLKFPPLLSVDQIQSFLSLFPNLEELSIARARSRLQRLRIEGSSLKLKHLELIGFHIGELFLSAPNLVSFNSISMEIRILRIAAPHLVSFNYLGGQEWTMVYIRDVPLLSQLSYSEFDYSDYPEFRMWSLKMALSEDISRCQKSHRSTLRFGAMTNLIQLKLAMGIFIKKALHMFLHLLEASPSLSKLSLDLGFITCPLIRNDRFKAINQCLEEVEIDGFAGFDNEVQLVVGIAQSSPLLKKMMLRLSLSKYSIDQKEDIFTEEHNVVSVVQSLQSSLPQIEFVII